MATTYNNLLTTATPSTGSGAFIAEYGTTTYNEISGALANEKTVYVKVTYDTDKYRYAPLTNQTAVDGDTNYYTFTCAYNDVVYTYTISELNTWSTSTTEIGVNDSIFFAIYDTTTFNEVSTALAAGKMVFLKKKKTYSFGDWHCRYAPLVDEHKDTYLSPVVGASDTYYFEEFFDGDYKTTYSLNANDTWTSWVIDLKKANINDIDSGNTTAGKVIMSNGSGGATWQNLPTSIHLYLHSVRVKTCTFEGTSPDYALIGTITIFNDSEDEINSWSKLVAAMPQPTYPGGVQTNHYIPCNISYCNGHTYSSPSQTEVDWWPSADTSKYFTQAAYVGNDGVQDRIYLRSNSGEFDDSAWLPEYDNPQDFPLVASTGTFYTYVNDNITQLF